MIVLELSWVDAACSELRAPNGEVLISIATPKLVRAIHREEGELVVHARPVSSLDEAERAALEYGKAWLAERTSVEEVYGSMENASREVEAEIGAMPEMTPSELRYARTKCLLLQLMRRLPVFDVLQIVGDVVGSDAEAYEDAQPVSVKNMAMRLVHDLWNEGVPGTDHPSVDGSEPP